MPIASWQLSLRRPAHCPFIWGAGVQSPSDPHGAALAGLSRAPRSGADAPRTRPACRSAGPRRWDYCSVHRTGRPPSGPFSGGLVRAGGASRFPHVEYAAPPHPRTPAGRCASCVAPGTANGRSLCSFAAGRPGWLLPVHSQEPHHLGAPARLCRNGHPAPPVLCVGAALCDLGLLSVPARSSAADTIAKSP